MRLESLHPEIAATGHGKPMMGEELRSELSNLVTHFDEVAIPAHGRYVNEPAVTNENGVLFLPPAVDNKLSAIVKVLGVTLAIASIALLIYQQTKKKKAPEVKLADLLKFQYN